MKTKRGRGPVEILLRVVLLAGAAYAAIVLIAFVVQRRLQYFPEAGPVPIPPAAAAEGCREVRLGTSDGVDLLAWHWPGAREATLLVLHGNAGHRGHRLPCFEALHARGWGLFLLDWRGYGGSGGSPSEEGLHRDAEAAWEHLAAGVRGPIALFGESIGCGPAARLAALRRPFALVLQGGAPSMTAVARHHYPYLPMGWILRDRFEALEDVRRISCPLLVVHGEADEIVPLAMGQALHDAAPPPREMWTIPGAGHNDLLACAGPDWTGRLDAFLLASLAAARGAEDQGPPPSRAADQGVNR